jgi:hypothetical protein
MQIYWNEKIKITMANKVYLSASGSQHKAYQVL